jgi:diguanylate cyclase (GGDEF)-like protein
MRRRASRAAGETPEVVTDDPAAVHGGHAGDPGDLDDPGDRVDPFDRFASVDERATRSARSGARRDARARQVVLRTHAHRHALPDAFASMHRRGTIMVRLAAIVVAATVVTAVVTGVGDGIETPRPLDAAAAAATAVLLAGLVCTDRHRRFAWTLLTTAVGVLVTALAWQVWLDPIGWERTSNVICVGGVLLLTVAVAVVGRSATTGASRSDRLDGVVIVLGACAGLATLWQGSADALRVESDTARLALMMVGADVLLLAVAVATVSAMRYRPTLSAGLTVLAATAMLVADLRSLQVLLELGVQVGSFAATPPPTPTGTTELRVVALLLIAVAAWLPQSSRADLPVRRPDISVAPVVASFIALVILGATIIGEVNTAAALLAFATVATIILRAGLTVHDIHSGGESYRLARTDELTGLTNRRGFLEGLDRLIEVAPLNVAVMVIDLNGFKEVNDSLGHHAGDELLRLAADRFRPVVGSAGLLARLGGDEFGVVIMVRDKHAALEGASMLQRSLDDAFEVDGLSVRVGAAIGVALYPSQARTRSGVLRSADVAMYDAKTRRTGVELYHPASDFCTRDKLQLLEDLREAIEHRRLTLHYQPKVGLTDGKITGSEALVRWQHPTRGLLTPDEFVPLAERAGLVPGLTRAVLAQAISFHAERCPHVGVSVNISHRDIVDDDLAVYISDLLAIYSYPAEKLTLEITETELAHDPERATRSIAHLRSAGIRISIDDFGVGYSSMARLLDLQVDEVKIDKSFVFAIADDARAIAIVRSTVELAAALGLKVVAEGIEDADVLAHVVRAGVDVGQGYLITRPLAGMDYLEFLAHRTRGAAPARPAAAPRLPDGV